MAHQHCIVLSTDHEMPSTINKYQGAQVLLSGSAEQPLKRRLVDYSNSNTISSVSLIFLRQNTKQWLSNLTISDPRDLVFKVLPPKQRLLFSGK